MRDRESLERIRALAIPPAWTDVWICADARGHLQATGRDAKGRKQYRYHPRWREQRDEDKLRQLLGYAAVREVAQQSLPPASGESRTPRPRPSTSTPSRSEARHPR